MVYKANNIFSFMLCAHEMIEYFYFVAKQYCRKNATVIVRKKN